MQVWNVLHAGGWKYRTQKLRKKSPYAHHRTHLSGYIFVTKACIDEPWATNGWDRLASLGHPSKFQRVSRLGFVTASTSLSGSQPNFARCLAVSWDGTLYTFWGSCPVTEFCQVQNSLCVQILRSPILYWQRYCWALEQWAWARLCDVVQGMELRNIRSSSFSTEGATYIPRAAITLGIGPHSSYISTTDSLHIYSHFYSNYLRQEGYVIVVCFSVGNFAQKLLNGFAWNFQERLAMGQWTNG